MRDEIRRRFEALYGRPPEIITRAPGRVNLIGEHTDYNDGFVLPAAIGRHTFVAAARRKDALMQVRAEDLGGVETVFSAAAPIRPSAEVPWSNYVRGMAALLLAEGLNVPGADLLIMGDMPQGAGLSSSAALENAAGLAFAALAGAPDFDRTRLAQIGQQTEHVFAGCNCGIMDQLVSARAQAGAALLIDCRSLAVQPIPMPAQMAIMIVHSGVTRGLVDGKYNERRQQCEAAARHFEVAALRDLSADQLEADRAGLDPVAWQRARHIVTENARVLAATEALVADDLQTIGVLMSASHASMRDDFQITIPAIDRLADLLAQAIGGQGGARMTGGGFGGAVVGLMPLAEVARVRAAVLVGYVTPDGKRPEIMVERPAAGVQIVDGLPELQSIVAN